MPPKSADGNACALGTSESYLNEMRATGDYFNSANASFGFNALGRSQIVVSVMTFPVSPAFRSEVMMSTACSATSSQQRAGRPFRSPDHVGEAGGAVVGAPSPSAMRLVGHAERMVPRRRPWSWSPPLSVTTMSPAKKFGSGTRSSLRCRRARSGWRGRASRRPSSRRA